MDISQKILSDIVVYMKYAKYIPELKRRETWEELISRNMNMHIRKYPNLEIEILNAYKFVFDKKVLPSMRALQFSGKPIEINPARLYNCSYLPIDDYRAFSEVMFLLLSGVGVGYSVQNAHIEKLPEIRKPNRTKIKRFLIGDSIEGWADAIKVLVKSYFTGGRKVVFDFRDIRQKGTRLITSGGKAPGPQPLKECILKVEGILDSKEDGHQLSSIEVHDIVCHLADAVLAGGIRRAALISLFDVDDHEMIAAKSGTWWEKNPQRGRANNSAVLSRHQITKDEFFKLWKKIEASGAGEPGVFFSNAPEAFGTNPCCEIALRSNQTCNLTEVNVSDIENQKDLNERVRAAAFIGTLQASYTDFHYLRPIWKKVIEKDALLGISVTGVGSGRLLSYDMREAAQVAMDENLRVSGLIGINKAARVTCVKPSGTAATVLGCSSGVHAWHSEYYIRRIRVGKDESIYKYLASNHPELIEDEYFRPHDTAVIGIPQKAPKGSIIRTESPIDLLERVKNIYLNWITPGHRSGDNTHNVSVTCSVKEDEWDKVGEWMWENKESYSGISVLPYDGGTYIQAPFEECSKEKYEELMSTLRNIDLSKIIELEDLTNHAEEVACGGGSCEIA